MKHHRPMPAEEFRAVGHRLIDWIADYQAGIESYPVFAAVEPGSVRNRLPAKAPSEGEDFDAILRDFDKKVLPGVTHWNHPGFFAYFPANNSGPGILGELLSAALGVNGMLWETCPAATELEEAVMEWLRKLVGLPEPFKGTIQDTASTSTLVALLTARERSTQGRANRDGYSAERARLTVYCTEEAHSSFVKGARIAGFGAAAVRKVPVDDAFAMRPAELARLLAADREAGFRPCLVMATIGTTSSTAIDPVEEIARICRRARVWLHVDAALAGSAALLPEMRDCFRGIEAADSFVFNPHKWLFTNFDCSAYFVRDPAALEAAFTLTPEYLRTAHEGEVTNFKDWGIALGRRFRALKLWFVLRYYGVEGLRAQLRAHLALARGFERWVASTPGWVQLAPAPFITVAFRYQPPGIEDEATLEAVNRRIMETVRGGGKAYFTHTRLGGKFALRASIGQTLTEARHVEALQRELEAAAVAAVAALVPGRAKAGRGPARQGLTVRVLAAGDRAALEDFLGPRADSSIFLLSNSRAAGLVDQGEFQQGTYFAAFRRGRLAGVAAHYWNGNLILQAPDGSAAPLVEAALAARVREVRGLIGPDAQVAEGKRVLALGQDGIQMDEREGLYGLDLGALRLPEELVSGRIVGRRAARRDLPVLVAGRLAYSLEALRARDTPELREKCRRDMTQGVKWKEVWVAEVGGRVVAQTAFNATLAEVVQVGGVWTPPAERGKGYARAAVAASLRDARAEGATRAVLFTGRDNLPAVKAYVALGFELVGDYRILLLQPRGQAS